jgi:transposase
LVGYARRNFMVPMPRFATWEAFNAWLEEQCRIRKLKQSTRECQLTTPGLVGSTVSE